MAKATGVGGVFFKSRDPQALAAWYATHLGIQTEDGGSLVFSGPESEGMTVFAPFPAETRYFGDSSQTFMVNFRVDDLDQLLDQLAQAGVRVDPKRETYSYGHFAWIWDPEGNRIELGSRSPELEDIPDRGTKPPQLPHTLQRTTNDIQSTYNNRRILRPIF